MTTYPSRCFRAPHCLATFLIHFLLLPVFLFAQNKGEQKKAALENEWTLNKKVNGVECFSKIVECGGQKVVFLKFNNTTGKSLKISWNERFVVKSGTANASKSSYGKKHLNLLPGITEQKDCGSSVHKELVARPVQTTPVYSDEVIAFDFSDLLVLN